METRPRLRGLVARRATGAFGTFASLAIATALLFGCATYRAAQLYADGTAALERGEARRAVAALEQAAALAPGASEIQNHLGLAYQAAGREAAARRAFERALELDCDNGAAAVNLQAALARERDAP